MTCSSFFAWNWLRIFCHPACNKHTALEVLTTPFVLFICTTVPYRRFTAHFLQNTPKHEFQGYSTICYSLFLQHMSTIFLRSFPCLPCLNCPTLVYFNWYAQIKKKRENEEGRVRAWSWEPAPDLIWNLFLPIRISPPFLSYQSSLPLKTPDNFSISEVEICIWCWLHFLPPASSNFDLSLSNFI